MLIHHIMMGGHKNNQEQLEKMAKTDHNFKYHEDEILKDIQEYVSRTYQGHYTGTKHRVP